MKKLIIAILLVLSVPAMAQIKSASLTASGLTCSMCSKAIYKALLNVPSIKDVQVDIKNSKYNIQFKENTPVVLDDVKTAVKDAGFSVASMHVTASFSNVNVTGDSQVSVNGNNLRFVGVSKQVLNGDKTFTIVDKDYISAKEYKKYSKHIDKNSVTSGALATGGRVYNVTL